MRAARHPNCAMIAGQVWPMRFWLLLVLPLCACSTFDAGPPPLPAVAVAPAAPPAPSVPADAGIRPLTEDQRAMLDV